MLELSFNGFLERLRFEQKSLNPTLHYVRGVDSFKLLFKNFEGWEYFTVVKFDFIIEAGKLMGLSSAESLENFLLEYCFEAVEILEENKVIGSVQKKSFKQSDEIKPGIDVVDESKTYEEFFAKQVDKWEAETLKALKKVGDEVVKKPDSFIKTFGEFLRLMTNNINTVSFLKGLKRIIKTTFSNGVESAEAEVNVQIGFSDSMREQVKIIADEQLNGYSVNGHKWFGIKGFSQDTQLDILKTVRNGLNDKKTVSEISKDVQERFSVVKSKADRIARTESTRMISGGKLAGYKDAGVERKAYAAVMDSKTSDVCRRLHEKYFEKGIPLDEPFIDDVTGKSGFHPPFAHPSCRCTLEARIPDES